MIATGKIKPFKPCEHEVLTRTSIRGEYRHIERSCLKCGEVLSVIEFSGYEKLEDKIFRANPLLLKMKGDDIHVLPQTPTE